MTEIERHRQRKVRAIAGTYLTVLSRRDELDVTSCYHRRVDVVTQVQLISFTMPILEYSILSRVVICPQPQKCGDTAAIPGQVPDHVLRIIFD